MEDLSGSSSSDNEELALELLHIVLHELLTKITSIKGCSELMGYGPLTENQKGFLRMVLQNVEGVQRVLKEVRTYAQIKTGKFEIEIEPVDLSTCVDEATISLQPEIDTKKQRTIKVQSRDLPLVLASKQQLIEVFMILLENSLEYIQSQEIILTAERFNNFVKVIITDAGSIPGQESLDIRPIGLIREKAGTGISLSFAKYYVEQWGGEIVFDDELGKNGAFWFTLPIAEGSEQ